MDADLEHRLADLEDWRDAFLVTLGNEPEARLAWRPGGTAWSALDTVQHLVLVEEGVVGYARRKLQAPPQPVSFLDRAKLALLVALMRSPIRVRAPLPQVVPAEIVPLADTSARWERVRAELRELLVSLPEERRKALLFRHPVSGPLDPAGTLDFVEAHARHHDVQFRRIWRAPGCPA